MRIKGKRSIVLFLLLLASCLLKCHGATGGGPPSNNRRPRLFRPDIQTSTIQILEKEQLTNGTWKHVGWEDALSGQPCAPPQRYTLEKQQTFVGDWKIQVSPSNSHGWTYEYDKASADHEASPILQHSLRSRVWLRTVSSQSPTVFTSIQNNWNFKGFGISLYKSALYDTFGIGLRLPLSINFDTWERHPGWPSLALTLGVFSPNVLVLFGNCSVRMESIQFVLTYFNTILPRLAKLMLIVLLRGLALAVSLVLYPWTRKPLLLASSGPPEWKVPPPQYSRWGDERIGMSVSYRIRVPHQPIWRPECRFNVWHYKDVQISSVFKNSWLLRHAAALGWSISAPVIDDDTVWNTASVLLSLSGFTFKKYKVSERKTEATASSISNTVSESSPTMSSASKVPASTSKVAA